MRLSTLVARRGSSVRVSGGSRLVVRELIVEPGAIFEWLGGTIEIDGGFWRHPEPIEIGCHDSARLLLTHRAEVHAPLVEVCQLGGLHGEGTLFAPVESSGEIAPHATGLDFDQSFAQNEFGLLRIMREPPSGVDERLAPSLRSRGPAQLSGFLALDWIDEDSGLPLEAWQVPCGLRFEVLSAQEVRGSVRSLHQRPCSSEFQVDLDARSVWAAMPRSLGCPDLDRDGLVTNAVLSALFELWGPCTAECCRGDIAPPGGDGVVDSLDLQELSLRLGEAVKP